LSNTQTKTQPITIAFLTLPYGISAGFISVTLPFILTNHGFSVSEAAAITAIGASASIWRFLWAPFTDLTLSLQKWYFIGVCFCASTILLLSFIPINKSTDAALAAFVFISQIAATFVISPVGGIMAKTVSEDKKGRAAGWFQAGAAVGIGLGGGAGLWLSTHLSYQYSVVILVLLMFSCVTAIYFVPKVKAEKEKTLKQGFKVIFEDIKELFHSRIALFTVIVILSPPSIGAAVNLWSSIGPDWKVNADTVALTTGFLSGVAGIFGCVTGGWCSDKLGRWWTYFGGGTLMAAVTLIMSMTAFIPLFYIGGVLAYAFTVGMTNAAFSALVLFAVGKGFASTRYALLSSIGNIPIVYVTAFDGWMHDKYSTKTMLLGETIIGIGFVVLFLLILSKIKFKSTSHTEETDLPEPIKEK
jgi:MFS family permease